MKHRPIDTLGIAAALMFVVGMTLAAQDRYAVDAANGIGLSEFRGYEAWQVIATSQPDNAGGCGTSKDVRQPAPIVDRNFEIEFLDAGVEAFVFTFG